MARQIGIKIHGLKEYSEALRKMGRDLRKELRKAIEDSCVDWEREAKRRCPVETGLLRSSITHEVSESGQKIIGAVGTNTEYGPYVEFGTRRIKVGEPEKPRITWAAKEETHTISPEWMPFLRSSWLIIRDKVIKRLEAIGKNVN